MVYHNRVEIDPAVCSSKPVIRGTRILVTSILSQLSAGETFESIRRGFPGLTDEDVPERKVRLRSAQDIAKGSS